MVSIRFGFAAGSGLPPFCLTMPERIRSWANPRADRLIEVLHKALRKPLLRKAL